jgi:hypothetical protein
MAKKITVELQDDLDGGPAGETVRFGVDSAEYEIDLSKKNAAAFRKKLAPLPFSSQNRTLVGCLRSMGRPRAATAASALGQLAAPSGEGSFAGLRLPAGDGITAGSDTPGLFKSNDHAHN